MSSATAPATSPPGSLIHRVESIVTRFELARMFPNAQPLEVELGAGDGSLLMEWARRHPDRNFIGVERLLGRLRKIDRKGRRAGLGNLRLVRIEAGYFLEFLLPPAAAAAVHVYFPDPWPKRRHWPRRLVNAHFVNVTAQALRPGGAAYLRTDDAHYFAQMLEVFQANPLFQAVQTPSDLASIQTDFERDFQSRGVQTLRAAFQHVK